MFTFIFVEGNADHETEEKWKKRCKIIRYACHVYLLLVIIGLNIRWCNEGEQIDTIVFLDIFLFSIAAGIILGVELSIAEGARPHCSSYTGSSTRSSHRTYSSWDSDDEDDSWLSSSWESGRTNDPWSHPWSTKSIAEENQERRMRQSDIEDMSYEKDADLYDHYDWEDIEDARDNDVF
ncbi:MAG: hypothetical protein MJY67_07600 [Bacteroidales bacterium]|nr:hypothetical protein [Bacteroidales bacterium]